MTITEARATPVPEAVLLTHRRIKAKVAAAKAAMDEAAATARQHVAELEAEYREAVK